MDDMLRPVLPAPQWHGGKERRVGLHQQAVKGHIGRRILKYRGIAIGDIAREGYVETKVKGLLRRAAVAGKAMDMPPVLLVSLSMARVSSMASRE